MKKEKQIRECNKPMAFYIKENLRILINALNCYLKKENMISPEDGKITINLLEQYSKDYKACKKIIENYKNGKED